MSRAVTLSEQVRAFAMSARTLSRLSVQYRNWAREAELQGQPIAAERWNGESRRLRDIATFNIGKAQERKGALTNA